MHTLSTLMIAVLTKANKAMSGYDITLEVRKYTQNSHQQVYRELKRIHKEGYIKSKEVAQSGKPDKIMYSLTKKGQVQLPKYTSTDYRKSNIAYALAAHDVLNGTQLLHSYISDVETLAASYAENLDT